MCFFLWWWDLLFMTIVFFPSARFPFSFHSLSLLPGECVCVCHFDGLFWCNGAVASRPLFFADVPMCITMCILYWYRLHFFVLSRIGAPFGFPLLFILLKKEVFCCPILSQCPLWFSVQIFVSFFVPFTIDHLSVAPQIGRLSDLLAAGSSDSIRLLRK